MSKQVKGIKHIRELLETRKWCLKASELGRLPCHIKERINTRERNSELMFYQRGAYALMMFSFWSLTMP